MTYFNVIFKQFWIYSRILVLCILLTTHNECLFMLFILDCYGINLITHVGVTFRLNCAVDRFVYFI